MGWPQSGRPPSAATIKGQKLIVQKQKPRQTSTSVIACASKSQWVRYTQHTGGTDRSKFCEFLQSLSLPAGSVLMMDNASIHSGDDVDKVCKEKGFSILYTPPYSPWFNPIENCFSIVKRRYPEMQNIQQCFESLKPSHFKAFFEHALKTYGIDDAEALLHKAEMTKPFVKEDTHTKRAKKPPANRSKHEKKEVSVEKHPQSDGTTLIVRTVKKTLQTIETRDTKTRTDTQVMTTTTTRVAKPGKVRPSKDIKRGDI